MYFLGPISWVLGKVADGAMATFGALFRWLAFWINELLYTMISNLYDVFIALCNGQLLDNDTLNGLFGRVGMLLGVVMMLRVAFSFIQMLIDPDSFSDKEKGLSKIVTKIIIVICMFGISGYVFEFLRDVQGEIIESNAIAKFFIPVQVNTEDFGGALSAELFTAFYNLDPEIDYSNDTTGCGDERFITTAKNRIIRDNDYSYARSCLLEKGTIQETGDEEYYISFNWIFSTLVAIFTLYFLLNYCISVGVRVIQLAVLQIISPMAIIGYLAPKSDNMFTKWGKLYFATYIDVFLRIAIINLVVYLCGVIMENWKEGNGVFWTSVGSPDGVTKVLIGVMMIMALLSFAKKAPELIKQLFPQSTSGLSLGLDKDNKSALGAVGIGAAGVGAVGLAAASRVPGLVKGARDTINGVRSGKISKGGAAWNAIKGAATTVGGVAAGGIRGVATGRKGGVGGVKSALQAQSKANLARAGRINSGQGLFSYYADKALHGLGMMNSYEQLSSEVSSYKDLKSDVKDNDVIKNFKRQYQAEYNAWAAKNPGAKESLFVRQYADKYGVNYDRSANFEYDDLEKIYMEASYKDLMENNGTFRTKVDMHNKRFGTTYNAETDWSTINKTLKNKSEDFEKMSARKPRN